MMLIIVRGNIQYNIPNILGYIVPDIVGYMLNRTGLGGGLLKKADWKYCPHSVSNIDGNCARAK